MLTFICKMEPIHHTPADLHANQEFQRLLDAIVESEEQRLAVGRALVDTQLEYNSSQQEFARAKFSLEQRILELEGEHAQELAYMVWSMWESHSRLQYQQTKDNSWTDAGRGCSS